MPAEDPAGTNRAGPLPFAALIATTGREPLRPTLDSLSLARLPGDFAGTYVVENGSPSPALEPTDLPPALLPRVLHEPRGNKSAALNRGLRRMQAEIGDAWVFMTDDDGDYPEDLFVAYQSAIESAPVGRFFGGSIVPRYESKPEPWLIDLGPRSLSGFDLGGESRDMPGVYFRGHNWVARLADMLEVGGFREDRGPGTGATGQESAMMRDLMHLGRVGRWVPDVPVGHHIPRDVATPEWLLQRAARTGRERALIELENRPQAVVRTINSACLLPILRMLAGRATRKGDGRQALRYRVDGAKRRAFVQTVAGTLIPRGR